MDWTACLFEKEERGLHSVVALSFGKDLVRGERCRKGALPFRKVSICSGSNSGVSIEYPLDDIGGSQVWCGDRERRHDSIVKCFWRS